MKQILDRKTNLQKPWVFIGAAVFFAGLSLLPLAPIFSRCIPGDSQIWRYIGMVINMGGVPYVDVFTHRTPLIYFLYALVHPFGLWGAWLLELTFLSAALFSFLSLGRRRQWPFLWLQAIVLVFFLQSPGVYAGLGLTRNFVASLLIIGIAIGLSKHHRRYFYCGLIFAAIGMSQQENILVFIPFIVFLLLSSTSPRKALKELAIGIIPIPLVIFSWLLLNGVGLADFWSQTVQFNRAYTSFDVPVFNQLVYVFELLTSMWLFKPIVFAIGISLFFCRRRVDQLIDLTIFMMVLAQIATIVLAGRAIDRYFIIFAPLVCLAFAFALEKIDTKPRQRVLFLVGIFIFLSPLQFWAHKASDLWLKGVVYTCPSSSMPLGEYLDTVKNQPGQIYVMRNIDSIAFNTEYNVIAPSSWINTNYWDWFDSFDEQGGEFQKIIVSLEKANTKYIVDFSASKPFKRAEIQQKWRHFLDTRYSMLQRFENNATLWQRIQIDY
jgi:hypothetical protein